MRKFLIFIFFVLIQTIASCSENVVFGYLVEKTSLDQFLGCNNDKLYKKILTSNKDTIKNINYRIAPLKVKDCLWQMISNEMIEDNSYAYQCLIEIVLDNIGQRIEDKTENWLLWNYMDLWLEAPIPILKNLGMNILEEKWSAANNPLKTPFADWPTVNYLNPGEINKVIEVAKSIKLNSIHNMKNDLFEGRGDELSKSELKEITYQIITEVLRWVRVVHNINQKSGKDHYLVLIFDGDI